MKLKLTTLLTLVVCLAATAQIEFADHSISMEVDLIQSVLAADIDGDGDLDVVSGSVYDDKVAWYENTDGLGSFGPQQVVSNTADEVQSVYASDLDGDGDLDILAAAAEDNHDVAWYENLDGAGTFGPKQVIIVNNAYGQLTVVAADLDNDGDMDVISGDDEETRWQENLDGQGTFGTANIMSESGAYTLVSADMDGDDDIDILSVARWDLELLWYENTDGLGNFQKHSIATDQLEMTAVFASDLDSDGDLDILAGYLLANGGVAWFENMDGAGSFAQPVDLLVGEVEGVGYLSAADMDGDGDNDLVSPSGFGGSVVWAENIDGQANFGAAQEISSNLSAPVVTAVADIDDDGDIDVLTADAYGDEIIWHENLSPIILSAKTVDFRFSIYPNPIVDWLYIDAEMGVESVELFNVLGELVLSENAKTKIDVSKFEAGVYTCRVSTVEGGEGVVKVVKY